ncbi:MAG: hypothetical protein HKN32_10045 [Flavobacteriales bacterium]|nr:hypothetical protein [Flavobacteriales bacterium]
MEQIMFVERQTVLCKKGRYRELQKLLREWSAEFRFPRAKKRYYFTYVGQDHHAICIELEFKSLDELQKAWEEWEEMAEEMAPYLEKYEALVDEHLATELWRVEHIE